MTCGNTNSSVRREDRPNKSTETQVMLEGGGIKGTRFKPDQSGQLRSSTVNLKKKKKSTYSISLVVYQGGKVEAEMSAGSADEEDEEDEAFGRQLGQPN